MKTSTLNYRLAQFAKLQDLDSEYISIKISNANGSTHNIDITSKELQSIKDILAYELPF